MWITDACTVGVCEGNGLSRLFGLLEGSVYRDDCLIRALPYFSQFCPLSRARRSPASKTARDDSDFTDRRGWITLWQRLLGRSIAALVWLSWSSWRGVPAIVPVGLGFVPLLRTGVCKPA